MSSDGHRSLASGSSARGLTDQDKSQECSDIEDNTEGPSAREESYLPMELGPDQILVPLKTIDYVIVYEDTDFAARDVKTEIFSKLTNIQPDFLDLGKLRQYFYDAMEEEGLEVSEERVGKRIFIKVHCTFERLCKAAESIQLECALAGLVFESEPKKEKTGLAKKFKGLLDMEEDPYKIYTPYLDKCRDWYLGNQEKDTYFRSAVRNLLVHNILININIYDKVSHLVPARRMIGLPFMLLKKAYLDAFVLHDLSTMETYSSLPCFETELTPGTALAKQKKGPLQLREFNDDNYEYQLGDDNSVNGMRVALDHRKVLNRMWVGFCKSQPLDRVKNYFGEKIAFYFGWVGSLVTALWIPTILGITVFAIGVIQRMDHDKKFTLKDANNATIRHRDVVYYVELIKASSDNILTPFFAFVICVWGTVQSEIWTRKQITLAHRWHMDTFDEVEPDRPQFEGTRSKLNHVTGEVYYFYPSSHRIMKFFASSGVLVMMVCVVFISVTSVIVYRVYVSKNYCDVTDAGCSMLHGAVVPTVLNTMSIMFLGQIYQWVAIKLTDWENHRTVSNYSDALIIKLFAFQFANTYTSLFYVAFFRRDLSGNKAGIMNMGEMYVDDCNSGRNDSCMSMLSFQLLSHMIIKPIPKFVKDIVIPQMMKMYRRFGPNRVHNLGEGDPSKQHYLLREMLKPPVEDFHREEMNEKIIQYGYIMMFSASLPLAPLFVLVINLIDMRVDAKRLLWLNRRPMAYQDNDIGMFMAILAFLNICGVCTNALLLAFTSDYGRTSETKTQLTIVLVFEHLVFFVKFLVMIVIPDVPTSVSNEKKLSQHFVGYLMTKLSSLSPKLVNSKTVLENPTLHDNSVPGDVAAPPAK